MPEYRWVVDADHPEGHLVELTADEEQQLQTDRQVAGVTFKKLQAEQANADDMAAKVQQRLGDLIAAADLVASGNATAQQQRDALALCLRTTARLARLVLRNLDVAV